MHEDTSSQKSYNVKIKKQQLDNGSPTRSTLKIKIRINTITFIFSEQISISTYFQKPFVVLQPLSEKNICLKNRYLI